MPRMPIVCMLRTTQNIQLWHWHDDVSNLRPKVGVKKQLFLEIYDICIVWYYQRSGHNSSIYRRRIYYVTAKKRDSVTKSCWPLFFLMIRAPYSHAKVFSRIVFQSMFPCAENSASSLTPQSLTQDGVNDSAWSKMIKNDIQKCSMIFLLLQFMEPVARNFWRCFFLVIKTHTDPWHSV